MDTPNVDMAGPAEKGEQKQREPKKEQRLLLVEKQSPNERCPICGGETYLQTLLCDGFNENFANGIHELHRCRMCYFISNPLNKTKEFNPVDFPGGRAGSDDKPGREFRLAQKAIDVFFGVKHKVRILIFGAGLSRDWVHIGKLPGVAECHITDLSNYQNTDAWIPLHAVSTQAYDLVIASEVIEHFEKPREMLQQVTRYVSSTGVILLSTNLTIKDEDWCAAKSRYLFYKGHCAVWSSHALDRLAEEWGFTMHNASITGKAIRKRVIFFFKDKALGRKLQIYMGHSQVFI